MARQFGFGVLVLVLLAGCSGSDGASQIIGSGFVVSETRNVTGFSGAVLAAPFGTIRVQQGAVESVIVRAEDNIIGTISTAVVGGLLVVDFAAGVQVLPTRSVIIDVVLTDVDRLGVSGRGDIVALSDLTASGDVTLFIDTLAAGIGLEGLTAAGEVTIDVSGVGDVGVSDLMAPALTLTVSGEAGVEIDGGAVTTQTIVVTGSVFHDALALQSATTSLDFSGTGDVRVRFTDMLTGAISGGGTVFYQGDPGLVDVDVSNGVLVQL